MKSRMSQKNMLGVRGRNPSLRRSVTLSRVRFDAGATTFVSSGLAAAAAASRRRRTALTQPRVHVVEAG